MVVPDVAKKRIKSIKMDRKEFGRCARKDFFTYDVLLIATKENIDILKKLEPLSCSKIAIGDIFCKDSANSFLNHQHGIIMNKKLQIKGYKSENQFEFSDQGKKLTGYQYHETFFYVSTFSGNFIVETYTCKEPFISLSEKEFFEQYKIVEE